jgi:hypothetical protein
MASTDLTNFDGAVAKSFYLDDTSHPTMSSGYAGTAQSYTASSAVTAAYLSVTNAAYSAYDWRVPLASYTTANNGTTMVGYGLILLSSGNTTGSTMVMPTISTASSALGMFVRIQHMGGTTGAWSISFPASHTIAGSTYNHLAFSSETTAYANITLVTASSKTYAVLASNGVTMSTT